MNFFVTDKRFSNNMFCLKENFSRSRVGVFLLLGLSLFLNFGCQETLAHVDNNQMEKAQEKIIKRDYDGARNILSNIYENSKLKNEKGEALYWIAYTHIKESSYSNALNYLENADKLYRNGNLLGAISARIIACALLDNNETKALKQYEYIQDKKVGEMPEINFIMGKYFQKKGDLSTSKTYFLRCRSSGDNLFARRASYSLNYVAEGVFYLQVGAYSNSVNANKVSQKIKSDYSLDTYIKESVINGNALYVICYGKFNTRQDADKELNNLKNKFKDLDLVIRP